MMSTKTDINHMRADRDALLRKAGTADLREKARLYGLAADLTDAIVAASDAKDLGKN